ncbi:MAG: tripartite tricarboxylate transporter permease [Synergistaceae bacterium]|uniref:tripartite tricarboxylate transporter permease n=1 Tax=Aminivibrio sp. TaxID=1872489 RepID=UPI002A1A584D|nr:tripartite tricarboxylate transporter permease [Synergistaceae bacterium]MDD3390926.1 tripartite tricarboxylate transporter permease [Synergistaceae bacterium]MDD3689662.1 tripartite tricarboxylate transporter permease [Synergistaceae bacterium]MDD4021431.1 tripartite tricarboxylate transporter permease [Synergistaceae bacterium]MDD4612141.1 tripartite tricarboxylate transporter permease [Synergistaceae bacterium]
MDTISHLSEGLGALMGPIPLLVVLAGVCVGILGGAMPGISPSMAVALLLPFTFGMSPSMGLVMLCAIYLAANYGGSVTAVMINTPGTPSAVVTSFDGYPLTRKGEAGKALGISLVSSVAGGFIGIFILVLFSAPLARFALKFWPAEYFALAILGLSTIASLGGGRWLESFIAVLLGLLLNTIGLDPLSGVSRYTFDVMRLYDGFSFIPVLIGLFALSEVFTGIESGETMRPPVKPDRERSPWPTLRDYLKLKYSMLRAGVLGTVIGIFPGAGGTIASFIAYDVEKRLSKNPEEFGKGAPAGVAAAEASNSSSVGGALVPLLTLGIPGSSSAAVLIGALMIHNLQPGPELFTKHPEIVYTLFSSLLVANVFILALGLLGARIWIKAALIPKRLLYPLIFAFSFIGSYAVRSSVFDVGVCLAFGLIGWVLTRAKFPVSPVVLGMILGTMIEKNLRATIMMGGYSLFLSRPLSLSMLLLALASVAVPIFREQRASFRRRQ